MSPSVRTDGVGVGDGRDAAAQRRRLAVGPVLADDDLGRAEVDARADLVRARAEHDDDPLDRGHGLDRADRVLEQRDAVQLGQLLGRAEARRPVPPRERRLRSPAAAAVVSARRVSTRARWRL